MNEPHPTDELINLRKFLERLESGHMTLRQNKIDVTKREIDVLKHEIAHLEQVIARLKSGGQNA